MPTDDELSRLAEKALLQEAQRGAQRAEISGPSGWLKCRLPSTNKTFLQNTLLGALAANRVKEKQDKTRCENGRRKRQLQEKERNTYKRVYIQASSKPKKIQNIEKNIVNENDTVMNKETKPKLPVHKHQPTTFVWSEEGLELSSRSKVTDSDKRKKSKSNNIHDNNSTGNGTAASTSKILPRNIKFVSSRTENRYDFANR